MPFSGVVIQHDKCPNQRLMFVCHWLGIRHNQSLCFAVSNAAYSTLIIYKLNVKALVMIRCVDSIYLVLGEMTALHYKGKSQAKSYYED